MPGSKQAWHRCYQSDKIEWSRTQIARSAFPRPNPCNFGAGGDSAFKELQDWSFWLLFDVETPPPLELIRYLRDDDRRQLLELLSVPLSVIRAVIAELEGAA